MTAADGADLGTGWFQVHAKTADGRLLFGGSRGILVVKPERFDASDYAPPLVVSELTIDGQRQPAGRIQEGLDLAPPQRGFTLTFAALDYSDPGRLRYAYRLHGFDTDWIATGAEPPVSPATATSTPATMSCTCVPPTAAASGVRTNWPSGCAYSPPGGKPGGSA